MYVLTVWNLLVSLLQTVKEWNQYIAKSDRQFNLSRVAEKIHGARGKIISHDFQITSTPKR